MLAKLTGCQALVFPGGMNSHPERELACFLATEQKKPVPICINPARRNSSPASMALIPTGLSRLLNIHLRPHPSPTLLPIVSSSFLQALTRMKSTRR